MLIRKSNTALQKAVKIIQQGGVVICPTDTVYGFIARADNKKAVEKIYKIKQRPKNKPLPVFVVSIKMARELIQSNDQQNKTLSKYWPGAHTFVVQQRVGKKLYGIGKKTIALRIPKYAFLQKLLKKINQPLVQTSVNISTQEPLNSVEQIVATFGKNKLVDLIIDGGDIQKAKSSKIIDLTYNKAKILRK